MKTRNLIGGAIVVAFIAGGYLGGLFPKFGGGAGRGFGLGGSPSDTKNTFTTVSRTKQPPDSNDEQAAANVLHVRIAGRNYAIIRAEGDQPLPLDQLVEQVQNYPGDVHGIRVRVSRLPTSKTTAELQLRDALIQSGLSEDEIDWQDGPRP